MNNLKDAFGSVLSFILGFFWFFTIFPIKFFKLLFLIISVPAKCKEHEKFIKILKSHPDFQKIKKVGSKDPT